jgi:DNA polymerase bacteriophage-type
MHYDNTSRATIDFESRSLCSLRKCGSWRYSLDPSTEVLCLAFHLPHWEETRTGLWHPGFPHLGIEEGENFEDLYELFLWLRDQELVEAHNAWFERGIWTNIMVPRFGWAPIRHEQWRCSAAKAAAHALPRKLEDVGEALEFDEEDLKDTDAGTNVMKKTMQPRKALKEDIRAWGVLHAGCVTCSGSGTVLGINPATGRQKQMPCLICKGKGYRGPIPELPVLWHESKELFEELWAYCRQDVIAEKAVSHRLIDLDENETKMFLMDAAVNERGFQLDVEAVDAALKVVDIECIDLTIELQGITEGAVEKATQRDKMKAWFQEQGLPLLNTQKDTIDGILTAPPCDCDIPWCENLSHKAPHLRRALELVKTLGRSSTSKYVKMRDWVCPDGRVRGGLLYHGASTGRWSGQGVQPHNFVKGSIKDMASAWDAIKTGDRSVIAALTNEDGERYADVMEVLSYALRGAIVPTPGHQLYVADYAAIEARVVLWLADDTEALEVFARQAGCACGGIGCNLCDIYLMMATDIWAKPFTKKDKKERGTGKIAILGLGYQMGWQKFQATALKAGVVLTDDFAQEIVRVYREKRWRVKQMWWDQEAAAIAAVNSGNRVRSGYIHWLLDDGFLRCELPSGRWLSYPNPEISQRQTPWGELKDTLTYEGMNQYSRKWQRQVSYGGMLVENITQAVARDLMAEAMLRCENSGLYVPVLSVHDELIAEAKLGEGSVHEFEQLMAECPEWADGCPVAAEGWAGLRYRK